MNTGTRMTIILAVVVALSAIAFGVLARGGELTDPDEIIVGGLQAARESQSGHFVVVVEGNLSEPDSGMTIDLAGATIEGDFDAERELAQITFSLPSLLGLNGEARLIGDDLYIRTSLTGPMWIHQSISESDLPIPEPTASADPEEVIRDFLATEGVTSEKLDDEACGEWTCYHVRLTVAPEVFSGLDPSTEVLATPLDTLTEPLVLDLLFDKSQLWLAGLSTTLEIGESTLAITVTLTDLDGTLEVVVPPADEIQEGFELP
jgi:hypothetical protein